MRLWKIEIPFEDHGTKHMYCDLHPAEGLIYSISMIILVGFVLF